MCFKPRSMADISFPMVFIDNVEIEQVDEISYLGVLLTEDYLHDKTIDKEIKLLYGRGNKITRLFNHCTDKVKVELFKTYCTSFYCAALWSNFNISSMRRIKVAHNTIFRMLMKETRFTSASRLFMEFNVPNLDVICRKLSFSLYKRSLQSDNTLVKGIVNSLYFVLSALFKQWTKQFIIKN